MKQPVLQPDMQQPVLKPVMQHVTQLQQPVTQLDMQPVTELQHPVTQPRMQPVLPQLDMQLRQCHLNHNNVFLEVLEIIIPAPRVLIQLILNEGPLLEYL
jgi:hypothetical protein